MSTFKTGGLPVFPDITDSRFEDAIEKTLNGKKVVAINNRLIPKDLLLTETGAQK